MESDVSRKCALEMAHAGVGSARSLSPQHLEIPDLGILTMHRFYALLILFAAAAPLSAQTLTGRVTSHSGYGGAVLQMTRLIDAPTLLVGGRGGWIANDRFVLGGEFAWTMARDVGSLSGRDVETEIGYGGIVLEYVVASDRVVHPSVGVLLGTGGVTLEDFSDGDRIDRSLFFLARPGGSLDLNITPFFRLAVGGGYRLVAGSGLRGVDDADLSGPYAEITFKFGDF